MMDSWAERTTEADRVRVFHGDSRAVLKAFPDAHFDSVVCDPPYALVSITKRFGAEGAAPAQVGASGAYARASAGFMGQKWDTGETAFAVEFWAEVFRVLKPGGHVIAFSGTRTYHRLAVAIEDAGFEIRDMVAWVYGSGFPKSHDVSKGIDKAAGVEFSAKPASGVGFMGPDGPGGYNVTKNQLTREGEMTDAARQWQGWGTALKPALEPVVLARKPLGQTVAANVLQHGTGALNIDASRIAGESTARQNSAEMGYHGGNVAESYATGSDKGRWPANVIHDGSEEVVGAFPETASNNGAGSWRTGVDGACLGHYGETGRSDFAGDSGSAARFFKSAETGADELLFWAAKSKLAAWNSDLANTVDSLTRLSNQAVASALSDALTWALPVTVTRSPEPSMSATPSELNRLLTTAIMATQSFAGGPSPAPQPERLTPTGCLVSVAETSKPTDTTTITISRWKSDGSADAVTFSITQRKPEAGGLACQSGKRFWYSSKADASDRCGSKHPTVKPVDLMAYLVRMVTPPGGVTLDPFAGSGTTGVGAMREGMRCVLIEREDAYVEDIVRKLAWARGEGRLTTLEQAKLDTPEAQAKAGGADLPLFGDA
jgi:DNA modification methylase